MDIKSTILTLVLIAGGTLIISSVRVSTFVTPHLSSSHNNFKIVTHNFTTFHSYNNYRLCYMGLGISKEVTKKQMIF